MFKKQGRILWSLDTEGQGTQAQERETSEWGTLGRGLWPQDHSFLCQSRHDQIFVSSHLPQVLYLLQSFSQRRGSCKHRNFWMCGTFLQSFFLPFGQSRTQLKHFQADSEVYAASFLHPQPMFCEDGTPVPVLFVWLDDIFPLHWFVNHAPPRLCLLLRSCDTVVGNSSHFCVSHEVQCSKQEPKSIWKLHTVKKNDKRYFFRFLKMDIEFGNTESVVCHWINRISFLMPLQVTIAKTIVIGSQPTNPYVFCELVSLANRPFLLSLMWDVKEHFSRVGPQ